ncbi:hypothetical protein AAFF_G00439690, partial [Aldrovandia affinis]
MERMSLRTRMAMMGDCQETRRHALPPLAGRPHCGSFGGNGVCGLFPHEAMGKAMRRASDPVRTQNHESLNLPRVQRFNSLHDLHPLPPLPGHRIPIDGRSLSLHRHTYSNGNLRPGPPSPRPPGIWENSETEDLAVENGGGVGAGGVPLLGEEDVLPDDVVQYLTSQGRNGMYEEAATTLSGSEHPDGLGPALGPPYQSPERQAQCDDSNKESLPVQWNEVSSGSTDRSSHSQWQRCREWSGSGQSVGSPFGMFGNMMVQQQLPNMSRDIQYPCSHMQNEFQQTNGFEDIAFNDRGLGILRSGQAMGAEPQKPCRATTWEADGGGFEVQTGRPSMHHIAQTNISSVPVGLMQQACQGPPPFTKPEASFQQSQSANRPFYSNLSTPEAAPRDPTHYPEADLHSQGAVTQQQSSGGYGNLSRQQSYLTMRSNGSNPILGQHQGLNLMGVRGGSTANAHQVKLEMPDHLQVSPCSSMQVQSGFLSQGFHGLQVSDTQPPSFSNSHGHVLSTLTNGPTLLSPGSGQVTSTADGVESAPNGTVL